MGGGGGGGEEGHYSVKYNVSFTEIICISMSHRLNVFFFHWTKILTIRMVNAFVLNILYHTVYNL